MFPMTSFSLTNEFLLVNWNEHFAVTFRGGVDSHWCHFSSSFKSSSYLPTTCMVCMVLHSLVFSSLPACYFSTALMGYSSCLLDVYAFRVLCLCISSSHAPESLWVISFIPMASLTHLFFYYGFSSCASRSSIKLLMGISTWKGQNFLKFSIALPPVVWPVIQARNRMSSLSPICFLPLPHQCSPINYC